MKLWIVTVIPMMGVRYIDTVWASEDAAATRAGDLREATGAQSHVPPLSNGPGTSASAADFLGFQRARETSSKVRTWMATSKMKRMKMSRSSAPRAIVHSIIPSGPRSVERLEAHVRIS